MTEELKPCPFCGERALIAATLDDMYSPMCSADGCCALDATVTRAEAIAAWNTRADRTALIEAGDALERYAVHELWCEVFYGPKIKCSCGYTEAVKNWREAKQ